MVYTAMIISFGWFMWMLRTHEVHRESTTTIIAFPDKALAERAQGIELEYNMTESLHVIVRALPISPSSSLERKEVVLFIEVSGTSLWLPWKELPFSRQEFIEELESQIDNELRVENGTNVVDLTMIP